MSGYSVESSQEPVAPTVLHHRVTATCVRDTALGATQILLTQVDVTEQVCGVGVHGKEW